MVEERDSKWIFSQAKWDQFEYLCELEGSSETNLDQDIEEVEGKFGEVVLKAAKLSLARGKGGMNRKAVPWWRGV